MARFKIWMEEQSLRREQQAQVQKIYDLAVQTLLGSAKDQTQLSLSDLKDDAANGKPPENKGPMVALGKLNKAGIFDRLKSLGNPDLSVRADQAQTYLRGAANNGGVGPKDSVGQFLNRLFGDDATDIYGKHTWKSSPEVADQPPQNNQQAMPTATSPPESQQPVQAPATGPDVPPGAAPGGAPDPNAPPPAPASPPSPGGAPGMPPMPGQPPQPGDPLQSPGGPMPPPPPGGLPMA